MSVHMIDDIRAIRFPGELLKEQEDRYALCWLGGDNNMRTLVGNLRSRKWHCLAVGLRWQVMACAAEISSDCEGGSMRFVGSRHTTPEQFIRRCRRAIQEASSWADYLKGSFVPTRDLWLRAEVCVPRAEVSRLEAGSFGKQLKELELEFKDVVLNREAWATVTFNLHNLDHIRVWLDAARRPFGQWCQVGGPGIR